MSEREVAAELVGLRYDCDDCGEEMVRSGELVFTSNPPQFPHRCVNGHVANLPRGYPTYDVRIPTKSSVMDSRRDV